MKKHYIAALLATATSLPAAVISDGVFSNANWTSSVISLAGASGQTNTITQALTGGNPNEYRSDVHTLTGNDSYTAMSIFNRYVPTQLTLTTAITSISYSYDLRWDNPSPQVGYRPALRQNGNVYHTAAADVANSLSWTANGMAGLTASSFCLATPGLFSGTITWNCGQNPNFSAGAGDIDVGYMIANSFTGNGVTVSYNSGLDNFSVTTVGGSETPEPGSVALMLSGVALAFWRLRGRCARLS